MRSARNVAGAALWPFAACSTPPSPLSSGPNSCPLRLRNRRHLVAVVAPSARPARRWRSHVLLRRANRVSLVRGRPYPSGTKRSWTPIRLASPFGDLAEAYNLRPQRIHQILRRWAPDAIRPQGHRRRRRRRVVAHGVAAPGCPGGSSPSKEARIIHAYATTDKPTTEIAEEFKVSKARVRAIVKQYAPSYWLNTSRSAAATRSPRSM